MGRIHDVFVCYSGAASAQAHELREALARRDLGAFLFESSQTLGASWEPQVLRALRLCQCVIVLVPADQLLSPWMYQEIGMARAFGKVLVPVALTTFNHSPLARAGLAAFQGCSLEDLHQRMDEWILEHKLAEKARVTAYWQDILLSDEIRVIHGGFEPRMNPERQPRHVGHGDMRAIVAFLAFAQRTYGIDCAASMSAGVELTARDLVGHDLVIFGGPLAYQGTCIQSIYDSIGLLYNEGTYILKTAISPKVAPIGVSPELCVVVNLANPFDLHRRAVIIAGRSSYGAEGGIKYLTSEYADSAIMIELTAWDQGGRSSPSVSRVDTLFRDHAYVHGSGTWTRLSW